MNVSKTSDLQTCRGCNLDALSTSSAYWLRFTLKPEEIHTELIGFLIMEPPRLPAGLRGPPV